MPDTEDRGNVPEREHGNTGIQPSSKPSGNHNEPTHPSNGNAAAEEESTVANLEQNIRTGERWLIGIGIATVIVNTVIALIYWGQLSEMRKATKAAGDSAKAAKSAADTAASSLESAQNSFKQEQRAYLWASSFNISNPALCGPQGQIRVCVDVHVANSGRTPAMGIHIHRYAVWGKNTEQTIKSMKVPADASPFGDVLGLVGDKWGTAATDPVTMPTAEDLITGKIPVYIYGVIQYFDIFEQYHETGFCSFKLPANGPFMACAFGNWFDKRPQGENRTK
jgi:Sec-independent protein translocase protein TatA